MTNSRGWGVVRTILPVATDVFGLVWVEAGSRTRLAAENLFLRKQLALHIERPMKPRRGDDATPITLVMLSRWIDLAPPSDRRPAGHADSVAPQRVPVVLANGNRSLPDDPVCQPTCAS
jgi:hypothetical protein